MTTKRLESMERIPASRAFYINSILRMVIIPITIQQTMAVTIDSSIAFQKLSSMYQMYSQKGATTLVNPAHTQ